MSHVILLGDSIFDNAHYVPGRPPVIEQVRHDLPAGWRATLLAVDGNITSDVARQLTRLPTDATHLVISVGGNDALGAVGILGQPVRSVAEALTLLHVAQAEFRGDYEAMLRTVLRQGKPTVVCTVYDAVPGLEVPARAALELFNAVILRCAAAGGVPVLDLRLICTDAGDYSAVSPIEPSAVGGAKIARRIAAAVTGHDFASGRSVLYA